MKLKTRLVSYSRDLAGYSIGKCYICGGKVPDELYRKDIWYQWDFGREPV